MKTRSISYGYYSILVGASSSHLLATNNERAFFVAQLQDLLSHRLLIGDLPAYKQTASCIDLLAFSIRSDAIQLVLFSIDKSIAVQCIQHALLRLDQYKSEYSSAQATTAQNIRVRCKKLSGPHHALQASLYLHGLHEDWEFDRYSSIGFYLHDRRGDWMRIWRITNLYDNASEQYRQLLCASMQSADRTARLSKTLRPLVS